MVFIPVVSNGIFLCFASASSVIYHGLTKWSWGGAAAPQNHLNLEKLGKSLSNYTKIWAIFVETREKMENLSGVFFAEIIRFHPQTFLGHTPICNSRRGQLDDAFPNQRNTSRETKGMHNLWSHDSVDILTTPPKKTFSLLLNDVKAAAT